MKNKLTYNVIVTAFFAIVLFNGCCKDENPSIAGCQKSQNEYYYKTLSGAKSYLWAKPGSYWIYKNTNTGDLDTQTVVDFVLVTDTSQWSRGSKKTERLVFVIYERLFVNIYSTFNKWIYYHKTNEYNARFMQDLNVERIILDRSVNGEGHVEPFFYPFIVDLVGAGTGSSFTTLKQIIPTYNLQGKIYQNVVVFNIDRDEIWERKYSCEGPNTTYYWAENVGLIKKDMGTCGYAWELIEYKIIN